LRPLIEANIFDNFLTRPHIKCLSILDGKQTVSHNQCFGCSRNGQE